MSQVDLAQEALVELPTRVETTTSSTVTVSQTAVAFNQGGQDGGQHASAGNQLSVHAHRS